MTFICLNLGSPHECLCGGYLYATGAAFEAPDGSLWCGEDCYEDYLLLRERTQRVDDCCPVCGYDNFEHEQDCPEVYGRPVEDVRVGHYL